MTLHLTTAARDAITGADGPSIAGVVLTRLEAGSGVGPGGATDAGRLALRTPRDAAAVVELDAPAGVVAVFAEITATADYDVTEVGLWGRIGGGAELLFAYWATPAAAGAIAGVATGNVLEIAATVNLRSGAGASAPIELARSVPGPPGPPGDCAETEALLGACRTEKAGVEMERDAAQAFLATCQGSLAICGEQRTAAEVARDAALATLAGLGDTYGAYLGGNPACAVVVTAARPRIRCRGVNSNGAMALWRLDGQTGFRSTESDGTVRGPGAPSIGSRGAMDYTTPAQPPGIYLVTFRARFNPSSLRLTAVA